MNFLKASYEEPSANNASRARVREKNRQDRLNEEVSAFFTKAVPVSTWLHQEHHRPTPSTEYWTIPDRHSTRRSDSYPPQSCQGSAGRTTVRTLNKHPSGSSGGISSPLRRDLLQRLEEVGCPNRRNTNSSFLGSSSMGKITRSIIETGVLDGTGSPRRLSYTQPSSHPDLDRDTPLLQTVSNAGLPPVAISTWNHQPQVKKNQYREPLAANTLPLRHPPTTRNDANPVKQAHVCPSEDEPAADTQSCINRSAPSIKSLPSSIPARPESPKSRLVHTLERLADNFALPQPHEKLGGQVITELQAEQGEQSRILQTSIPNPQQSNIAPNFASPLLPLNPDLQAGFPLKHAADSWFYHDITRGSASSIQTVPTNREDFDRSHASPPPLIRHDAIQLMVNPRQHGQSTDIAHYIATIESEVLGSGSDSKLNDICHEEQWKKDTDAYIEPVERSQDGHITGQFTRRGLTLPLAVKEDTGISMVDFWTRNPFIN